MVADESDSEESEVEDVSSDENDEGKSSVTVNKPTLRLSGGFQWGVVKSGEDATEKSSESETEEKEVRKYIYACLYVLVSEACGVHKYTLCLYM